MKPVFSQHLVSHTLQSTEDVPSVADTDSELGFDTMDHQTLDRKSTTNGSYIMTCGRR